MFEIHVPRVFCQWDNMAQSLREVDFWKFQLFFNRNHEVILSVHMLDVRLIYKLFTWRS